MKAIYKYPLSMTDQSVLYLPYGAQVLSVINQAETIVLYAIVDTQATHRTAYQMRIAGTGHHLEKELKDYTFIGSVTLSEGRLVFHVFYLQGD